VCVCVLCCVCVVCVHNVEQASEHAADSKEPGQDPRRA
jgi:hypothetical protein